MENNKSMIIPATLKGVNYLLWSRLVKTALGGRGLWSHVSTGEAPKQIVQGEDGKELVVVNQDKWDQEDLMVLSLIQNSLEPSILEAYSYCESSKELWETLYKVYGNVSNLSRVFEVKKAINSLNQEDTDFTAHFGKFRSLWAELEMLRPHTIDPTALNERREQDKVFGLLLTLNSMYNDLIKHILRADKLPSLEEVCSQIQKEQGSLCLFGGKRELITINQAEAEAVANKSVYRLEDKRNLICEHCKRKGHQKDKCWLLHPHLKPNKFRETRPQYSDARANLSTDVGSANASTSLYHTKRVNQDETVKRSDIDALIKALKESGISKTLGTSLNAYHTTSSAMNALELARPLVIDSGASHHMISDSRLIKNVQPSLGNVMIANGDRIPIKGIGELKLFDKVSKAFYMPTFASNLVSVKKTTNDLNCNVIFTPNEVYFQDIKSSKLLGKGVTKGDLYLLEDTHPISDLSAAFHSVSKFPNDVIWHARLGHPHSHALNILLPSIKFKDDCEACVLGKHCKIVFPKSQTIYDNCFDLIHSDVWTAPCASREQHKYFVTFIDEKSKYTWITLLQSKDRVLEAFKNFQSYVTNHFNVKIKILRSDNGGEYTSTAFKHHLATHGIIHQTSCPYTPQQNGVAERKNRHLMEVARSMMFHTNVPKRFWGDAVVTAAYLINRIPTKVLLNATPYEVLNQTKPSIDHLRVFGCVCFVLVPGELRNKLDARSTKAMFVGYSTHQKGYKCYVPETRRILVSRDVKFMEAKGYYEGQSWEELKDLPKSASDRANNLREIMDRLGISLPNTPTTDPEGRHEDSHPDPEGGNRDDHINAPTETEEASSSIIHDQDETPPEAESQPEAEPQLETPPHEDVNDPVIQPLRRSTRLKKQETSQEEKEVNQPVVQPLRRSTRLKTSASNWSNTCVYFNVEAVAHPPSATCSLAYYPEEHQAFVSELDQEWIPKTYEEAMEHEEWKLSVEDEVGAMIKNDTWFESELPKGKKAVTSRLLYTIKYLANGKPERKKTRLVARGYTQVYGEDYLDTFAPVAKLHTIRILLSVAVNLEWDLWQMDVKNAFLQGELDDEVYMRPPPGLEGMVKPGNVWRLKKAIYGLKQSPRAWYHKLSATLNGKGFVKSEADHSLFTLTSQQGIVIILVYVDDIIITGNNKEGILSTKSFLKHSFDIKDLGELKYFLGIEICRSKEGLFLSQRKYALDILNEAGNLGSKKAKTPLEEGYKVLREGEYDATPFEDIKKYRRMVGKLLYLTITRPDVCYAVNQVSQHMQAPKVYHWSLVERILRYLRESPGQGIWMACNKSTEVVGYCDADWAGDRADRRSTTGYCTFIGGNLVTWKSKKQPVVSCSSAEAEYRSMRKLTSELIWIKGLLKDLGIEITTPITMHCDNQAAIHIASNSVFHERTKHIEIDCHKVRQAVEQQVILPCYTRSEDQLADIFTKAANSKVCEFIHPKLGLIDLTCH